MEALLYLLPALGCGLMMVVMMAFMGRRMAPPRDDRTDDNPSDEVAALRNEVARLRAERGHDEAHADG